MRHRGMIYRYAGGAISLVSQETRNYSEECIFPLLATLRKGHGLHTLTGSG